MAGIPVKLARREPVAEGTWAFHLSLGGRAFDFKPGQAIDLKWEGAPTSDPRGHVRAFSIASSPGLDELLVATRIRESPFKKDLLHAPLGVMLEADGPWGEFVLPRGESDVVMLAGGIGVTPFRSIVQDAVASSLPLDLSLIHSARTPEEAPFVDEFRRWTTAHHRFTYLPTMTQPTKGHTPWLGERRRVDAAFLDDTLDERRARALYMVSGPPSFVQGVTAALVEVGVPKERVLEDRFDGY